MKTYEYEEGKRAQKNFEEGMKAVFQVPKDSSTKKKKAKRTEQKVKQNDERDTDVHKPR